MRKVILSLSFMLIACVGLTHAQAVFKKFGFNKAPLTLSNGKYNEFFTNEEIVQIGTVKLNTRTNQIVEFLEEDTTKANYKSEFSSRWLSVDPLAEKYPNYSPYAYCYNNPIVYYDPDGRQGMAGPRMSQIMENATPQQMQSVGKWMLRLGSTIEDIYGAYSGKDFDGNAYNRASAAGFMLLAIAPELKMFKYLDKALDGLKAARTVNAGSVNRLFLKMGMKAPYDNAYKIIEGTTKADTKFVRVHGKDNKVGRWLMDANEIKGLSPEQIRDKFALPDIPTQISEVTVPAGTNIRVGTAAEIKEFGKGGGLQVEVLQKVEESWVSNTKSLK